MRWHSGEPRSIAAPLCPQIKAWEKEKEAIAKAAEKAEKEMEKKKPGKGPAPEPYDLDKHLAELGPAPEHGGLVGALLAEGAVLHTMNTTMTPPEAEPRDPKAKMTKEEEERLVSEQMQQRCGRQKPAHCRAANVATRWRSHISSVVKARVCIELLSAPARAFGNCNPANARR